MEQNFMRLKVLVLYVSRMEDNNFLWYEDTASANMSPAYLRRWKSISGKVKGKLFSWKSFPYTLQKSFCQECSAVCGQRFKALPFRQNKLHSLRLFCFAKNQSTVPLFFLSAKSHARLSCSLINALTQLRCRYQLFAVYCVLSIC